MSFITYVIEAAVRTFSIKKVVLKVFPKLTGKYPYRSLLFNNAWNVIKKRRRHSCFSQEFSKIFKNTFFMEQKNPFCLRSTATDINLDAIALTSTF